MIGLSVVITASALAPCRAFTSAASLSADALHGCLARLDQQLPVPVAADVEPEEVETRHRGATMLVLSSLKARPLGASHSASCALTCFGLFPADTHHDQIVGVPDHHRSVRHRLAARACRAGECTGPCGLSPFRAEQRSAASG